MRLFTQLFENNLKRLKTELDLQPTIIFIHICNVVMFCCNMLLKGYPKTHGLTVCGLVMGHTKK